MENASKALLIAGAVLIVILLISVGILIYNGALGNINAATSQADAQAIMGFNARFELYEGTQTGTAVKNLLKEAIFVNSGDDKSAAAIIDNIGIYSSSNDILDNITNATMKHALTDRWYGVRYVENIQILSNLIKKNSKYNISFEYKEKGVIWKIHID